VAELFPAIVLLRGSFSLIRLQLLGMVLNISGFKRKVFRLAQNHYKIISAKRSWIDASEAIWYSNKWKKSIFCLHH
jgi:hypothetical protein